MKYWKWLLSLFILAVIVLVGTNYPKLDIISGYAAKNMASTVFIAGRTPISVDTSDHDVPLIKLARVQEASDSKSAVATVFGQKERRAVCREGLGCVLLPHHENMAGILPPPHRNPNVSKLPFPLGSGPAIDTLFPEVDYQRLDSALETAFSQNETQRTRTVMVLYKGQLLAEKYTEGFKRNTPVLGWSMTKSILATLYGILSYKGKIAVDLPAPVTEWQQDERQNITLDNLLRMESGLAWEEDYSSISDVTRMLFLALDMSRVQLEKKAVAPPGEVWNYSSGTSNLLSGILRSQFRSEQEYLDFPYAELIDPIGMSSMMIETDMAGNFVGSSYGWASTADWAKFGLLYLNEGEWNGRRFFDKDWVAYVTRPTSKSNGRYGAHFWLNRGGVYDGVPKDLYSANGYQGQYVFIIPSLHLVVVRTGLAEPPDFQLTQFLQAIVASIRPAAMAATIAK